MEPSIQFVKQTKGLLKTRPTMILPLRFKENHTYRGRITGDKAKQRKLAMKHRKAAEKKNYTSVVDRWDKDQLYRENCLARKITRSAAMELDVLAKEKARHTGMSFNERKQKNKNHSFWVVQEGSAGGQTVDTVLHPGFVVHQAKAKAKSIAWEASSSSTSRPQWTSQSWWTSQEWSYRHW